MIDLQQITLVQTIRKVEEVIDIGKYDLADYTIF